MLVALLLSLQTVAAPSAGGDVLDELIAKTSQLKSFTATYEMTIATTDVTPAKTEVNHIRVDYLAPDKLRLEMSSDPGRVSQWMTGGVLIITKEGAEPAHARIDLVLEHDADYAPVRRAFEEAFPSAEKPTGEQRAILEMNWSFDGKTQKANFGLQLGIAQAARTPLAWLTGVCKHSAPATESSEQLLFDDGHIQAAISKRSGFLEMFTGTSVHGTMTVHLKSLEADNAIDPQRFVPPSPPLEGADIGDELRTMLRRGVATETRYSLYRQLTQPTGEALVDAERAQFTTVARAIHEYHWKVMLEFRRPGLQQGRERAAGILQQLLDQGHSQNEVAADRVELISNLNDSLDKQRSEYSSSLAVPEHSPPFPHADELLQLEREVATKAFDELVRAPIVHDFEQTTSLEKK